MADETTKSITTTSDGNVTITVEKYHELIEKAAEKEPVTYTTVMKTPEMAADENKVWGIVLLGGGSAFAALGAIVYNIGRRQANKIEKENKNAR